MSVGAIHEWPLPVVSFRRPDKTPPMARWRRLKPPLESGNESPHSTEYGALAPGERRWLIQCRTADVTSTFFHVP